VLLLQFDRVRKSVSDKRGREWREEATTQIQGYKDTFSAHERQHLTPRRSPQLGSQAANMLAVLFCLKHIHFLSTVPVWGGDIFSPLKNWYFLVPIPTLVFHTVQHCLLQMVFAPAPRWREGTWYSYKFAELGTAAIKTTA